MPNICDYNPHEVYCEIISKMGGIDAFAEQFVKDFDSLNNDTRKKTAYLDFFSTLTTAAKEGDNDA